MFTFDLYTIDSWDKEYFKVFVDDVEVYSYSAFYPETSPRPANCGLDTWNDRIQTVAFSIPHYRSDFVVKLTSTLD